MEPVEGFETSSYVDGFFLLTSLIFDIEIVCMQFMVVIRLERERR